MSTAATTALLVSAALGLVSGCGDGGSRFDAAGFIAAANDNDAGLRLGERLPYSRPGVDERALRFAGTGTAEAAPGGQTPTDVHGAGTLSVFDSDADAVDEFERCERGGLVCYRAGNVALSFFGTINPADLERLTQALKAMAGEP